MRGVAERFPSVYESVHQDTLLRAYRQGPERIEAVLHGLSDDELRSRSRGPERWSAIEIALHVADSELVGAARVRMVFAGPGGPLPMYDQDLWTTVFDYRAAPMEALRIALIQFKTLRETTAPIFERAKTADWNKSGIHAEYGSVTLRNLLELYADHSERHVEQVLDIRSRIGRDLDLDTVLPDRLY